MAASVMSVEVDGDPADRVGGWCRCPNQSQQPVVQEDFSGGIQTHCGVSQTSSNPSRS